MLKTHAVIAMPTHVNATNAIQVMAQGATYWRLGAESLVPEYLADADALRARVVGELAQQPRYAGQTQASKNGDRVIAMQGSGLKTMSDRILRAVASLAGTTGKKGTKAGQKTKVNKAETEDVIIPQELLAAAAKLAKLAQQYEDARKLASKALAQAFAK
jgi:hypothetical protein